MKELKFMLRFEQRGRGFKAQELYKDVSEALINKQVANHVVWESAQRPPLGDNGTIHVEIPYKIKNDIDPSRLTIENIKTALIGLLDKYDSYTNLQISE